MNPLDRAIGTMLGLACGDAVGTTLEFHAPGTFEPITDMVGGGHQIGTDAKGNIYVAAIARGVQKLTFKGIASPAVR